jgi:hypothetical protein
MTPVCGHFRAFPGVISASRRVAKTAGKSEKSRGKRHFSVSIGRSIAGAPVLEEASEDETHFRPLPRKAPSARPTHQELSRKCGCLFRSVCFVFILVLYHAQKHRAFWLDVQAYVEDHAEEVGAAVENEPATITVRIPAANKLTVTAIDRLRDLLLDRTKQLDSED